MDHRGETIKIENQIRRNLHRIGPVEGGIVSKIYLSEQMPIEDILNGKTRALINFWAAQRNKRVTTDGVELTLSLLGMDSSNMCLFFHQGGCKGRLCPGTTLLESIRPGSIRDLRTASGSFSLSGVSVNEEHWTAKFKLVK